MLDVRLLLSSLASWLFHLPVFLISSLGQARTADLYIISVAL